MKILVALVVFLTAALQAQAQSTNLHSKVYNKANHKIIQQHMMMNGGYSYSSAKKMFEEFSELTKQIHKLKKSGEDFSELHAKRKAIVQKIVGYVSQHESLVGSLQVKQEKPVQRYAVN